MHNVPKWPDTLLKILQQILQNCYGVWPFWDIMHFEILYILRVKEAEKKDENNNNNKSTTEKVLPNKMTSRRYFKKID